MKYVRAFNRYGRLFLISILIILVTNGYCQEEPDFKERQDSILEELRGVKPWYEFGNEKITIIPLAILALDATYFHQDDNSTTQVGDQDARYEPGQIRALRFGVLGTINFERPWRYLVAGAYRAFDQGFNADSATDFMLYDLRLDIPTKIGAFAFGKMKEPSSMQRVASLIYLGGIERGMNLDGMLPARNTGAMYYNTVVDKRVHYALALYKSVSFPQKVYWKDASTVGIGRITVNPFVGWQEDHDLHLGISGRYSNFKGGGNLRQHPESYFASKFVETGGVEGEGIFTWNYEFAYRFKSLLITSEVTRLQLYNARLTDGNESLQDPRLKGSFVQADWLITGERRKYTSRNAVFAPAIPRRDVQQGGAGALEFTLRYSTLLTNTGGLSGGDMSKVSAFLTWYPTLLSKMQIGYGLVTLDRFGITGKTGIFQFRFAILIG
ncbi:MAG: porin [Bacteroidota bacterium]